MDVARLSLTRRGEVSSPHIAGQHRGAVEVDVACSPNAVASPVVVTLELTQCPPPVARGPRVRCRVGHSVRRSALAFMGRLTGFLRRSLGREDDVVSEPEQQVMFVRFLPVLTGHHAGKRVE